MPSPSKIRNSATPSLFDDLPADEPGTNGGGNGSDAAVDSGADAHAESASEEAHGHAGAVAGPPVNVQIRGGANDERSERGTSGGRDDDGAKAASRRQRPNNSSARPPARATPPESTRSRETPVLPRRTSGDDSSASAKPELLTVSRLAGNLRTAIESQFTNIWVEGEISNFKRHSSGHCYFTLKDDEAQLRAVMWRSSAYRVFFQPRDGMLVQVLANASMYESRGSLQLIVRKMRISGEGALQKAFDALKRKLATEGLFSRERKRRLPAYPRTIGIVTSGTGAALHDILSILERRFPYVCVMILPVQVQGVGAAEAIAKAIRRFNNLREDDDRRPDVLIVGRGGGSLEDLWAFNEEVVARAVSASTIPIISAVGHETDISICDYVADARAATPSMAAELAVPDRTELRAAITQMYAAMGDALMRRIENDRKHIKYLTGSYGFRRPVDRLHQHAQQVDDLVGRLHRMAGRCVEIKKRRWKALDDRLRILGPERPLRQGYVLVERNGEIVRRSADLMTGDHVQLRFGDGRRGATVASDEEAPSGSTLP